MYCLLSGIGLFSRIVPLPGIENVHDDQRETNQNAGHNAAKKQLADGDAGSNTKDDHGNARRDHDPDRRAGSRHGNRYIRIKAFFNGRRDQNAADGCCVSCRTPCNPGKKHAGDNVYMKHSAFEATYQGVGKPDQILCDAAQCHKASAKHEKRNRDEGKGIHSDIKSLNKGHIADVAAHYNAGDCGEACAKSNRHIKEHQTNHDQKRYQSDHAVSPSFSAVGSFFSRAIRFSIARSTNNAPMIGKTR